MAKTYSAYLCSGCGIGEALDLEALSEVVTGEMSMECKTFGCLCGTEGKALIEKDIKENGVNTLVIGACSPRVMEREFDFGADTITVRANLREQVVWSAGKPAEGETPHPEAAAFMQETASDYMRMACTRAQRRNWLFPISLNQRLTKPSLSWVVDSLDSRQQKRLRMQVTR